MDARNDARKSHALNPPATGSVEWAICASNEPEGSLDMLMILAAGRQANRGSLLRDLRRGRRMMSGGISVVSPILGL